MTDTLEIVEAVDEDLPGVVEVHLRSFPGFFLSRLGPRFLRAYYKEVLHYEHAHFFVAKRSGCLVGFVTGFYDPTSFYTKISRHALHFFVPLIIGIATSPSILFLVIRKVTNFFLQLQSKKKRVDKDFQRRVELSSLAVCPTVQGEGIGGELVHMFIRSCYIHSPVIIYLTTDAADNKAVNRFYAKLGFRNKKKIKLELGRAMNTYELFISEAA